MKIELFGIHILYHPPQTHTTKTRLQPNPNKPKQTSNGFSKKRSYGTRRGAEGEGRKNIWADSDWKDIALESNNVGIVGEHLSASVTARALRTMWSFHGWWRSRRWPRHGTHSRD